MGHDDTKLGKIPHKYKSFSGKTFFHINTFEEIGVVYKFWIPPSLILTIIFNMAGAIGSMSGLNVFDSSLSV